jgi:hypothetical protein
MVAGVAGRSGGRVGAAVLAVTAMAVSSMAVSCLAATTLAASPAGAKARPAAVGSTIKVNGPSKYSVSPGFVGLTFEATSLGSAYFDPAQSNLPTYLDELGRGDLRIGGQTSDLNEAWLPSASDPLPSWASSGATPADLDAVGTLIHETDWSVDLGVNLLHFDPALAADEVAAARTALGPSLHAVEIGNEPDLYFYFLSFITEPPADVPTTFPGYLTNWNAYVSAIDQSSPGVAFAGPDFYLTTWLPDETKKTEKDLADYTQHFYPLEDCGGAVISPQELLAPSSYASEDSLIASALQASKKGKLPLVLDEFNSISCGSSSPATWEFASSLWAVHALVDAASDGVSSVNVQMDPGNCNSYSPLCVPDPSSPGTLAPTPIFYAMQLVSSLEGGTLLKTAVKTAALPTGVYEEAVRLANGNVAVVVDNTTASAVGPLSVQLDGTARLLSTEQLAAPSLTATSGVTLTTTPATDPSPTGLAVPGYTADVFTLTP